MEGFGRDGLLIKAIQGLPQQNCYSYLAGQSRRKRVCTLLVDLSVYVKRVFFFFFWYDFTNHFVLCEGKVSMDGGKQVWGPVDTTFP